METRHDRLEINPTASAIFVRIVRTAWQSICAYQARRRQTLALQQMDQHELRDLGLAPQDIDAVIDGSYIRDTTRVSRVTHALTRTKSVIDWHKRSRPGIHGPCSSC